MKSQESTRKKAPQTRALRDIDYRQLQKRFDTLVIEGAELKIRKKFITDVYTAKNRAIRDRDFQILAPKSIEADYLRPRKELSSFVLRNWVNGIFLPSLRKGLDGKFFLFGLGRMFSAYNDVGVQSCSDADLNFVLKDDVPALCRAQLEKELLKLRREAFDRFGIVIEIHPEYTIQDEAGVEAAFSDPDPAKRLGSALFYKSNEKSIFVFKDHPEIRAKVFSRVSVLPDSCLFEHFLGLTSGKNSYMKIRLDKAPLAIVEDFTYERRFTTAVIGSREFGRYCYKVFRKAPFLSPPDWYFSMKYFVNRVYDYVCAMRNMGYSLEQIGFDSEDSKGGPDFDYVFLRNTHKLMLYLQELLQLSMGSYSMDVDYSYISRTRFLRLMEIHGDKFRKDFDEMVLGGDLLLPTNREKYLILKRRIVEHSRERTIQGARSELDAFPKDFEREIIYKDSDRYKARVPYSWADLGFFVFTVIAMRVGKMVDSRLVPPLAWLNATCPGTAAKAASAVDRTGDTGSAGKLKTTGKARAVGTAKASEGVKSSAAAKPARTARAAKRTV